MKPKLILTHAQAVEMRWFCQNVTGLKPDYYKFMDAASSFGERLRRLEKTCTLIEKFLAEHEEEKEAKP